jgi:hypothetical protein
MKNTIVQLIFICFFAVPTFAIDSYNKGEQLYVMAQSGLTLRMTPDFKGSKLATIPYGDKVVAQEDKWNTDGDSIKVEVIKSAKNVKGIQFPAYVTMGRWLQVKHGNTIGFVFDGYLSAMAPFTQKKEIYNNTGKPDENGGYEQVIIYDDGTYHQMDIGEGGVSHRFVIPNASLVEGFLFANSFMELEKYLSEAMRAKEATTKWEVGKNRLFFESEHQLGDAYYFGSVLISHVSGAIVIDFGLAD